MNTELENAELEQALFVAFKAIVQTLCYQKPTLNQYVTKLTGFKNLEFGENKELRKKVLSWWKEKITQDEEEKKAKEQERLATIDRIREVALSKLTPQERKVLGIRETKTKAVKILDPFIEDECC